MLRVLRASLSLVLLFSNFTLIKQPKHGEEVSRHPPNHLTGLLEPLDHDISEHQPAEPEPLMFPIPLCDIDANFLSYEDYTMITDPASRQWEYRVTGGSGEHGIRTWEGRYQIATSLYYGVVGDFLTLTFDNGTVIETVVADSKGDICSHHPNTASASSFEFLIDPYSYEFSPETQMRGSFNHLIGDRIIQVHKEVH